jgi:hypothetical protein
MMSGISHWNCLVQAGPDSALCRLSIVCNTDIRVGVYVNVRPDCTSGPLPSIQLTSPPENGKVTVKKAQVTATNYKQCLALEVPGFVAFYRSREDFAGVDVLTLEVKFPDGKTQVQRISVTVGSGSPGRRT